MIGPALVIHGQELAGTPPAELLAAAGFVLTTAAAVIVRGWILRRPS